MSISPAVLGEHIRNAREKQKLTLKDLADKAGIGKTAMFDLEHGNPGVRLNTLQAVLAQLGMDLNLIHLDDEMSSEPTPDPTTPPPSPSVQEDLPDHLL